MLVLIDNYDSFTYNLVQYFQILGKEVQVFENDKLDLANFKQLKASHLVISPGPKGPMDAGISLELIKNVYKDLPILGICLGHQCIGHAFGATVDKAPEIMHGKTSLIKHHKRKLFSDLPTPFKAMRYHSLAIKKETLPESFSIDAWADDTIMAISHREYPLFGIQFHPESILTEHGQTLLSNFLKL